MKTRYLFLTAAGLAFGLTAAGRAEDKPVAAAPVVPAVVAAPAAPAIPPAAPAAALSAPGPAPAPAPAPAAAVVAAPAPAPAPVPVVAAEPALPSVPGRIGYVDMEKLFQGYYKTGRSDGALKKQKDLFQQRVTDGAADLDVLKKERDECREKSMNIALSDDARAEARRDAESKDQLLRDRDRELREFVQSKDRELGRKYFELRNEIVKEINEFVKEHGRKNRYETLMDISGLTRNYIPAVVYYDKDKEITDALLAELNKGHEDEAPKVEASNKDGLVPMSETGFDSRKPGAPEAAPKGGDNAKPAATPAAPAAPPSAPSRLGR